jgi:hypothetical protein
MLLPAAVLALFLVPLGSEVVQTEPITIGCGFGAYYTSDDCTGTADSATYDFGPYKFVLTFADRFGDFFVNITDAFLNQTTFDQRAADVAALYGREYDCVPMVDPSSSSSPCRDFVLSGYPSANQWSSYVFTISWLYDSENNGFANTLANLVTVLHDIGEPDNPRYLDNGNNYDEDMCLEFSGNCTYSIPIVRDPEISSGDTDFQSFTPAITRSVVPEPATMLLMGAGLGAILYRRRRRSGPGGRADRRAST